MTSHSTHLRTFFALKPGAEIIRQLSACIDDLQGCSWSRRVRWASANNIHLTLRFLGNTDPAIIPKLLKEVSDNGGLGPVGYEIDKILIFPSASRPRVIAASVAENPRLNELVEHLEKSAQSCGFEAEKKSFRGHFTLARCRRDFPKRITLAYPIDPIRSQASEIVLYQSDTRPSGAVYTSLGTMKI